MLAAPLAVLLSRRMSLLAAMRPIRLSCLLLPLAFSAACRGAGRAADAGAPAASSSSSGGTSGASGGPGTGGDGGSASGGGAGGQPLGSACGAGDCAAGLTCLTAVPGGYCTAACGAAAPCPAGGACVEVLPGQSACGRSCASDVDCARGGFSCDPACRVCIPSLTVGQIACGSSPAVGLGGHRPDGGACGALPVDAGPLAFGPPIEVSGGPLSASEAEGVLAAGDAGIVVAFMAAPADGGASRIGTAVSTDRGATFEVGTALAGGEDEIAFDPSLAVDGSGRFYLAWAGVTGSGAHLWVESSAGGVAWSTPVNALSPGDVDPGGGAIDKPSLAVSPADGRPYVAFGEFSGEFGGAGPYQIRLVGGAAGAASFSPGAEVDNGGRAAFRDLPSLAFDDSGFAYLTWVESTDLAAVLEDQASGTTLAGGTAESIWFALLLPGPQGVSPPKEPNVEVSGAADRVVVDRPALAVSPDGANLYVVYVVGGDDATDIVVAASEDEGATWGSAVPVNADRGCATHFHPAAFLDGGGRLFVSWVDNRDGTGHVFYAVSEDGARTFGPAALVSPSPFVFDTLDGVPAWLGGYQTLAGAGGRLFSLFTAPTGGAGVETAAHVYLAAAPLP